MPTLVTIHHPRTVKLVRRNTPKDVVSLCTFHRFPSQRDVTAIFVDDNWELYDLKTDLEEMHNLYGKKGMEKITTELKAELARLQKEYDVPQELCR